MKYILVIKTPPGTAAPECIRVEWVGLIMPIVVDGDQNADGWCARQNQGGHIVGIDHAISALRAAGRTKAADFWEGIKDGLGEQLRFAAHVCEVIET